MAEREIVKVGNEILRQKAKKVLQVGTEEIALLQDLKDTLEATTGVGISAPQIGVGKRAIVVSYQKNYALLNPEIIEKKGKQLFLEGCLSVEKEQDYSYAEIERAYQVTVKALNKKRRRNNNCGRRNYCCYFTT